MRKYLGEFGLIITAIIWGSGFVASAIALEYYTPYQTMFVRFFVGALILCLVFFNRLKQLNKKVLINGIILGSILYLAFVLQTVGLQFTTPSKNAFLTAVNVVIVPIISFLIYKRQLDRFEVFGSILAMTGVGIISLQLTTSINIGDLLSLLCAFAFAFHIFYTAQFVKSGDAILLTLVQMITASVIGFILIAVLGEVKMPLEARSLYSMFYLGVFSTAIAFLLQTAAQKFVSETKAGIILSTEALWGTIFSILIIGEIITLKMALGSAIILLAIIISETKINPFKIKLERQKV
ncbi:DMT family transporter [Virgibacillus sp. W0430]|uniref:DMT family transporter n=1 Tax=Virgibacillus sp. W0430 TaxID=3391580 RepID=UPI003F445695